MKHCFERGAKQGKRFFFAGQFIMSIHHDSMKSGHQPLLHGKKDASQGISFHIIAKVQAAK